MDSGFGIAEIAEGTQRSFSSLLNSIYKGEGISRVDIDCGEQSRQAEES